MKKTRFLAVAVCIVVALLTLCACGGVKVTFDLNYDGAPAATVVSATKGIPEEPAEPEREGYVFGGWYLDKECTDFYDFFTGLKSDTTLYALWDVDVPIRVLTMNYNYDGAPKAKTQNVDEGTAATEPRDPSRTGYVFGGWFTQAACTTEFDFATLLTADTTIYAKWTIEKYDVVFNLNYDGAATAQKANVEYNNKATKPADPTREGYVFGGWYAEAACENAFDFETAITAEVQLYAKWTAIPVYKVTINLNYEGAATPSESNVYENETATKPADPTRANFNFTGWFADQACATPFDFAAGITKDTVVYAGWVSAGATVYDVTLDYNYTGSPTAAALKIEQGQTVTKPANPVRSHYTFDGWFTDKNCTSSYDFSTAVSSAFTLYAKWNAIEYVVTFNLNYDGAPSNGVLDTKNVIEGSAVSAPTAPTRDGYTFVSWCVDTAGVTAFDFETAINEAKTLYAKWIVVSVETTYVFEAEDTNLDSFVGPGYSGSATGTNCIGADWSYNSNQGAGASNGHFVTYMYAYGCSITFEITSDREVENATLILRLSAEHNSITVTSQKFTVSVNNVALTYNDIVFTDVPSIMSGDLIEFDDYTISVSVHLVEGKNTIVLMTTNSDQLPNSGTMAASAPIIDCLKIKTTAVLTWDPATDNYI